MLILCNETVIRDDSLAIPTQLTGSLRNVSSGGGLKRDFAASEDMFIGSPFEKPRSLTIGISVDLLDTGLNDDKSNLGVWLSFMLHGSRMNECERSTMLHNKNTTEDT